MTDPGAIVPYWVHQGDLVLLDGPPGSGKSAVALDLALSAALGASWLGALRTGTIWRSCVLDCGMSEDGAKRRLAAQARARGVGAGAAATLPFAYHCGRLPDFGSLSGLEVLRTVLAANDLVVLDWLGPAFPRRNVGLDWERRAALRLLADCAHDSGCALVVVDVERGDDAALACDARATIAQDRDGRELVQTLPPSSARAAPVRFTFRDLGGGFAPVAL